MKRAYCTINTNKSVNNSFNEPIDLVNNKRLKINNGFKIPIDYSNQTTAQLDIFEKHDLFDNIKIHSFSLDDLERFKNILHKKIEKYMKKKAHIEQILNMYL